MTELALKWAWRYYSLDVELFDSLDQAIRFAGYASDDGQESLDCIEVWDKDGYRRLEGKDVWEEIRKAEEAATPKPEPVIAKLSIVHPDGKRVLYSTYSSEKGLGEDIERLRPLGDRVQIERLGDD